MAFSSSAYDTALDAFARALPWITTLSVLVQLPRLAHTALNHRRAQLIYDEQGVRPSSESGNALDANEARNADRKTALILKSIASFPVLAMLFLYMTPSLVHDGKRPILALIRNWLPVFLFACLAFGPLLQLLARREVMSGRYIDRCYRKATSNGQKMHECTIAFTKAPGVTLTQQYEYSLLAQISAIPFVVAFLGYLIVNPWLDARLALGIPSAIWALSYPTIVTRAWPTRRNGHYSFRGLTLVPVIIVLASLALAFAVVGLIFVTEPMRAPQPGKPKQPRGSNFAWDFSQDVPIAQLLCFVAPLGAWLTTILVPAAMCVLVYRYDAGQVATPTAQERQMALLRSRAIEEQLQTETNHISSTQAMLTTKSLPTRSTQLSPLLADPARTPIMLSAAAVPMSTVPSSTTFKAGFYTLVFLHLSALGVSLMSGMVLPGLGVPRIIRSPSELDDAFLAIFVPQLACLAVFIVPIAMLVAAERVKQGGARQLWTYSERWSTRDEEEAQDELALRPSFDESTAEQQPLLRKAHAET